MCCGHYCGLYACVVVAIVINMLVLWSLCYFPNFRILPVCEKMTLMLVPEYQMLVPLCMHLERQHQPARPDGDLDPTDKFYI